MKPNRTPAIPFPVGKSSLSELAPKGECREKVPMSSVQRKPGFHKTKPSYLHPRFKARTRMLARRTTLLRFFVSKWKYEQLSFAEFQALLELTKLLSQLEECRALRETLSIVGYNPTLDGFLQQSIDKMAEGKQFLLWPFNKGKTRVDSFRQWNSLKKQFQSKIRKLFVQEFPREETGKKGVVKPRIRGHTDKGTLPRNPILRDEDRRTAHYRMEKEIEEYDRLQWEETQRSEETLDYNFMWAPKGYHYGESKVLRRNPSGPTVLGLLAGLGFGVATPLIVISLIGKFLLWMLTLVP